MNLKTLKIGKMVIVFSMYVGLTIFVSIFLAKVMGNIFSFTEITQAFIYLTALLGILMCTYNKLAEIIETIYWPVSHKNPKLISQFRKIEESDADFMFANGNYKKD